MERRILHILTIILFLSLCSCSNNELQHQFDTVESVVSEHPDSAMQILQSIPNADKLSKIDKARYDLLMAETRYMSGIDDTIPNRLLEIAEYFDTKQDKHNAARAYYYAGIVEKNIHDYGDALVNLLKAEKRAIYGTNNIFLGRIYRTIADCYAQTLDWRSSLNYYKLALEEFEGTPKTKYSIYARYDIAQSFYAITQYDSALHYAKSALENSKSDNEELAAFSLRIIAKSHCSLGQFNDAISKYLYILENYNQYVLPEDYTELGLAYLQNNDLVNAEKILILQKSLFPSYNSILELNISERKGNYKRTSEILKSLLDYDNNEVETICSRNFAQIVTGFYQSEESIYNDKVNLAQMEFRYSIVISTLVLIIVLFVLFYGIKYHNKQKRNMVNRLLDLKYELAKKNSQVDGLNQQCSELKLSTISNEAYQNTLNLEVQQLLHSQINLMESIVAAIEKIPATRRGEYMVYKKLVELVDAFNDDQTIDKLESLANQHFDNIIYDFKEDFPQLKVVDYQIFLYIVLDFSSKLISFILKIDTESVYRKKYKLKIKVLESNSLRKTKYLKFFSK